MSQPLSGVPRAEMSRSGSTRASDVAKRQPYAPRSLTSADPLSAPKPAQTAWTVRRARPAERQQTPTRKFSMLWRARNGDIMDNAITAPALPAFENAFNAFARGALIPTENGPVAIEDLLPGDRVLTADEDIQTVEWIGSMRLDLQGTRGGDSKPEQLYRVAADSFGLGRPAPDLILGEGARYLYRSGSLRSYLGTSEALAPISALEDGVNVTAITPMSSVNSYHLCLSNHALIRVNGVELESYHPGTSASGQLIGEHRRKFLGLFPHLAELGDFGAMVLPRLSPTDLLSLSA